jgi:alpha-mannosidase
LFPHQGSWDENTIREAYAINNPLMIWEGRGSAPAETEHGISLVQVDQPNLVIETIKAAQDGEGLIIRLYESQRMRGGAILTAGFPIKQAWLSNIMEENQKSLNSSSNQVEFSYKPYQIITLRVEPE